MGWCGSVCQEIQVGVIEGRIDAILPRERRAAMDDGARPRVFHGRNGAGTQANGSLALVQVK